MSEQEHHHRHHRKKSKLKPVVYSIISFFLTLVLFLLSICTVAELTIFSKDYMLNIMDSVGYDNMVKYELQSRMTDLVNASGFEASFAESFTNSYDVKKAVENYIESFYSGDSTLVETTGFKQQLYAEVQNYAQEKNIEITDEVNQNITYFINEASSVYVDQISIPFFSVIGKYIYNAKSVLNIVSVSLGVLALILAAILFFTNQFKHRRYKYLCYGLLGGALTTAVLPTIVFLSGKISQVNINTRSLYNLFVSYFNSFFYSFYLCAGVMLALAAVTFIMYVRYYSKYTSS